MSLTAPKARETHRISSLSDAELRGDLGRGLTRGGVHGRLLRGDWMPALPDVLLHAGGDGQRRGCGVMKYEEYIDTTPGIV